MQAAVKYQINQHKALRLPIHKHTLHSFSMILNISIWKVLPSGSFRLEGSIFGFLQRFSIGFTPGRWLSHSKTFRDLSSSYSIIGFALFFRLSLFWKVKSTFIEWCYHHHAVPYNIVLWEHLKWFCILGQTFIYTIWSQTTMIGPCTSGLGFGSDGLRIIGPYTHRSVLET